MIELLEKRIKELQEKIEVPKQTQNYYNCIGAKIFECEDLLKEVKKLNIDDVSKCQHPYKKVISGDDGMWCTECNKYITTF